MTSAEIRQAFLDFFASKGHTIVPSAPLVIKNDPTLMFTNAGMNQFKDYFLGNEAAPYPRAADTQKCLRVSGKHNDLEDVGLDTYHHTMFEMLGNWSFGDYFKKEAVEWSWQLLTEVFQLPKDRLYATVFGGDEKDGLPVDQEAFDLWTAFLPAEQILHGNKKDNFWEMGDTGPCGPCSEIHIDLRSDEERALVPGRKLVNQDNPQVIEIWNNVFMEFNRMVSGELVKLPAQHVDTGMGFERLCMAIQGKKSNYDTDVFTPLIEKVEQLASIKYGSDEKTNIAVRVIVDHIRAIAFAIADGQLPSNVKAGYVIRRILRRAVRYGYTFLNLRKPFLMALVPVLAEQMGHVFPEIKAQQAFIVKVIEQEEVAFLRTLETGLSRLEAVMTQIKAEGKSVIDGPTGFELFDTFGFPFDLTALIARENGLTVDEAGFEKAMAEQKDRSRKASASATDDWQVIQEGADSTFVGYDTLEANTKVLRYRKVTAKDQIQYQIVLETTPFYAESGGQVGDVGVLTSTDGLVELPIVNTLKENNLFLHITTDDETLEKLTAIGNQAVAKVDVAFRQGTSSHHSATHLLHAALRRHLGTHVEQKGSLVQPDALRFDFSHFEKVSEAQIAAIENEVNEKVRANIPLLEERNLPIAEAKAKGAMALFGEKYGDSVRVITFDPNYSVELCGGTHVSATGAIGLVKLTTESAVAAGVRRIEAVVGNAALSYVDEQVLLLAELKTLLKNPQDAKKALASLIEEKNALAKELEKLQLAQLAETRKSLLANAEAIGDFKRIVAQVEAPHADAIKSLAFELRNSGQSVAIALAANLQGKPHVAVILSDDLVGRFNATQLIKGIAPMIQGGGGGQPFFATAGGKNLEGIAAALEEAKRLLV